MKNKLLNCVALALRCVTPLPIQAADYVIDTEKARACIQFRVKHLGYS